VYALDVQREMLGGKRGLVPALWHLEIADGLALAERRGDLSGADVEDRLIEATAEVQVARPHANLAFAQIGTGGGQK
jgi:hypothetical protein